MGRVLVEIDPQELKFIFELKKQSSCSIRLVNITDGYIAFKVKTTSPKRYCVRPNTGVILPKSTCEFTVTMQAQKETPPEMQLKDKFLVQSTTVPFGTTEEDIVPSFFTKENDRYIQENKLRVVLVSPPQSPASEFVKGPEKLEPYSNVPVAEEISKTKDDSLKQYMENKAVAPEPIYNVIKKETADAVLSEPNAYTLKLEPTNEAVELEKTHIENNGVNNDGPIDELPLSKSNEPSTVEVLSREAKVVPSHVAEDVDVLMSRLNNLEIKLQEADKTILKLSEDNRLANEQRDKLLQDIALLRRKSVAKGQVGFPFLFVVFVALIGLVGGYLLHS